MLTRITDTDFGVSSLHSASGTTYRLDIRREGKSSPVCKSTSPRTKKVLVDFSTSQKL